LTVEHVPCAPLRASDSRMTLQPEYGRLVTPRFARGAAPASFAGHSSLQVTMDGYGHLLRSDNHGRAMDVISAEMRPSAPATQTPKPDLNFG
jgi:hypothetical protein